MKDRIHNRSDQFLELGEKMTDYNYRGIWVDPVDTDSILVLLDQLELQLIVLALDWACKASEAKLGAQTKRFKQLSARMRELHHQRVNMVNQLAQAKELAASDQNS